MKKKLSERVNEYLRNDQSLSLSATNRAQFLGVKDEVEEALEAGCKTLHIWKTLTDEGRITCKYEVFRRHVKKLLVQKQKLSSNGNQVKEKNLLEEKESKKPADTVHVSTKQPSAEIPGFRLEKTDIKDLI